MIINPRYEAPEAAAHASRVTREAGVCLGKTRFGYGSALGEGISRDPIGEAGGINLYEYVGNNPVYWVDPTGLDPAAALGALEGGGSILGEEEAGGLLLGGNLDPVVDIGEAITAIGVLGLAGYELFQPAHPPGPTSCPAAKAPGQPTADDGYTPPKNWDGRKAPNPNGPGSGYPDENGDVWMPTGTGPSAHGGPHWDVQSPGGGYQNIYPGGRVR